jgi:hypothetical protein
MTATNAFETAMLNLYFLNTDHANVGDAAGIQNSAAAGNFFITLHTATLTDTSTQLTSETAYTNYARQAVPRTAGGWTVTGDTASNAAVISFPTGGATGSTVTDFGVGSDGTLIAGNLFFWGTLAASRAISSGITPSFAIGELDVTCD